MEQILGASSELRSEADWPRRVEVATDMGTEGSEDGSWRLWAATVGCRRGQRFGSEGS